MPEDSEPRMESPILRELHAYWESRRFGRSFPRRADFEPTDITPLLPHVFLIDVERGAELRFRVRLQGTFIDSVFQDAGARGYLNDHELNRRDPTWLDPYRRVVTEARPNVSHGGFEDLDHRRFTYERLVMPLSLKEPATVDMIVGALAFAEPIPSPPAPVWSRKS